MVMTSSRNIGGPDYSMLITPYDWLSRSRAAGPARQRFGMAEQGFRTACTPSVSRPGPHTVAAQAASQPADQHDAGQLAVAHVRTRSRALMARRCRCMQYLTMERPKRFMS